VDEEEEYNDAEAGEGTLLKATAIEPEERASKKARTEKVDVADKVEHSLGHFSLVY
jgi:hypothetical protein